MSIAPFSAAPLRRRSTKRRSLAPLFGGAAIGLGAIALALFARSGGHFPLSGDAVSSPALQVEPAPAAPIETDDAVLGALPEEADRAEADEDAPRLVSPPERPAADATAEPVREASEATVDARPEVRDEPTPRERPRTSRPRPTPARPDAAKPNVRTRAQPTSEPPTLDKSKVDRPKLDKPGKPRDLDNPYR